MQIPETPHGINGLDLMQRLRAYAEGQATWKPTPGRLGSGEREACEVLCSNLAVLVDKLIGLLLDRVPSHEMGMFTMHDRGHGLKVAHVMWHLLTPIAREHLTPPEIGILVAAAHFHDLGMALSNEERDRRLDPCSDLWDMLDTQAELADDLLRLRAESTDANVSQAERDRAVRRLAQAEEVLLCEDTRSRHARRERYEELRRMLAGLHQRDSVKIPDVEACLSFDGDSFADKMFEVCVSHGGDADSLVRGDERTPGRPALPRDYPVGCAAADMQMCGAALRLSDILDFDRERTPAALFYYLLPGTLSVKETSVLEWSKHLAISSWHIEPDAVVFRGRCNNHIVHHAVVQFCDLIAEEIASTRAVFGPLGQAEWPFILPSTVKADIHAEGYRYIPYKFELDDERVYNLLMGGAIYDNPLVAVRELVQNAVDACTLRDALTAVYEPHVVPGAERRITIRYEEPGDASALPLLSVIDTGTGMDAWIIERFFLKVGRSYYHSRDFGETRVELRRRGADFAPVSEFGIGFLSVFLLADRVEVETAMWDPIRGDGRKHKLVMDGPTRLIRVDEQPNEGRGRFKGTRVSLSLCRGGGTREHRVPPSWRQLTEYLKETCLDLPYALCLEHIQGSDIACERLSRRPTEVRIPPTLASGAIRIPVADRQLGLEGQIAILSCHDPEPSVTLGDEVKELRIVLDPDASPGEKTHPWYALELDKALLRGGFRIGSVPGLPHEFAQRVRQSDRAGAILRLTWENRRTKRYLVPNIARSSVADEKLLSMAVARAWLSYLLDHVEELPSGVLGNLSIGDLQFLECGWLEGYDALSLYQLARRSWLETADTHLTEQALQEWERGVGPGISLMLNTKELHVEIINLIMPRITALRLEKSGITVVRPPMLDWRDNLRRWRGYVSAPVSWGQFASFQRSIRPLLFLARRDFRGWFNSRYQSRLADFSDGELETLSDAFIRLSHAADRSAPAGLTKWQCALLRRAGNLLGEYSIGEFNPWGGSTTRVLRSSSLRIPMA